MISVTRYYIKNIVDYTDIHNTDLFDLDSAKSLAKKVVVEGKRPYAFSFYTKDDWNTPSLKQVSGIYYLGGKVVTVDWVMNDSEISQMKKDLIKSIWANEPSIKCIYQWLDGEKVVKLFREDSMVLSWPEHSEYIPF